MKQLISIVLLLFFSSLQAQITDVNQNEFISLSPNLSVLEDPLAVSSLPQRHLFDIKIDLNVNPFKQKRVINMVKVTAQKAQSQNYQLSQFNFVDRQLAMFRKEKPQLNNSLQTSLSPGYHDQYIYSNSNRVNNQAFKENETINTSYFNRLRTSPFRRYRNYWRY